MFIAFYIPLLAEQDHAAGQGYKHLAPPEQGTSSTKRELKPIKQALAQNSYACFVAEAGKPIKLTVKTV